YHLHYSENGTSITPRPSQLIRTPALGAQMTGGRPHSATGPPVGQLACLSTYGTTRVIWVDQFARAVRVPPHVGSALNSVSSQVWLITSCAIHTEVPSVTAAE